MADRAVDRRGRREAGIGAPQSRDRIDVKQRQSPADRLFEAAIGVAVEGAQEARHVPIGPRADAEQRLRGAGQELPGGAVVQGHALPRFEAADKTAQLIGLGRPHPDREIAGDLHAAGAGQVEAQRDVADDLRREREAAVEPLAGGELDGPLGRRGE